MKSCDVWIAHGDHQKLMAHLFPGDQDEHGAILRCGVVEAVTGLRFVVRDVEPAVDGKDYLPGQYGYRALQAQFIHKNIMACRNERLAYLAVHNHDCDERVAFSLTDMESHELGYPALRDIGRGIPVGALVFGRRAVEADVWLPSGARANLGEFRVIGSTIQRFYPNPRRAKEKAPSAMDRQVRMFGAPGQAMLKDAKVAIVGLGGVGSLLSEYLARLGVGHLLLIDPDRIDATNLARVVGATLSDVKSRTLKIDIAARVARHAQPDIDLELVAEDVAECPIAEKLVSRDFIFLAADSMRARLVVNAIGHQYFVPATQLGAKIRAGKGGKLVEAMSVVRQVRPRDGCLWCGELIDPGQLALESKSDVERKQQAYGTSEPNPSVITMNSVAAAVGANDFLFDFLNLRSDEGAHFEHFQFLRHRSQRVTPTSEPDCPECGGRYGRGDSINLPCIPTRRSICHLPDASKSESALRSIRRWLLRLWINGARID